MGRKPKPNNDRFYSPDELEKDILSPEGRFLDKDFELKPDTYIHVILMNILNSFKEKETREGLKLRWLHIDELEALIEASGKLKKTNYFNEIKEKESKLKEIYPTDKDQELLRISLSTFKLKKLLTYAFDGGVVPIEFQA